MIQLNGVIDIQHKDNVSLKFEIKCLHGELTKLENENIIRENLIAKRHTNEVVSLRKEIKTLSAEKVHLSEANVLINTKVGGLKAGYCVSCNKQLTCLDCSYYGSAPIIEYFDDPSQPPLPVVEGLLPLPVVECQCNIH